MLRPLKIIDDVFSFLGDGISKYACLRLFPLAPFFYVQEMITLIEDENKIVELLQSYLETTPVLDWKYEAAIKQLIAYGFQSSDESADLHKLGAIYKRIITNLKDDKEYTNEEEGKILSIAENMEYLSTAVPIVKLLRENKWKATYKLSLEDQAMNASVVQAESPNSKKKNTEKNFSKLSVTDQFAHLTEYYGDNGVFDVQQAKIPRRFTKYFSKMKKEAGLCVQPWVTLKEREMLIKISECKNKGQIDALLAAWYLETGLSCNCRYIRFALAACSELWSTNSLLKRDHGEDWYRMHLYSNVWDKAFMDDEEFETKRSECVSQVTKTLKETDKETKLQKLDFILRDLNTDHDVVTVEEKPSLKGVKADIKKGGLLKKHALYLWSKQVKSDLLMKQLEAISCQWQGRKFSIFGSRLLSSDQILTYSKGSFSFPISMKHLPEFATLLMAILSLKRTVKMNYAKFSLILEEKYKQEIKTLDFEDDPFNEISFVSNSTNIDSEEEEEEEEMPDPVMQDFDARTMRKLEQLTLNEEDLKQFADWEDMLMFDHIKRRRTVN